MKDSQRQEIQIESIEGIEVNALEVNESRSVELSSWPDIIESIEELPSIDLDLSSAHNQGASIVDEIAYFLSNLESSVKSEKLNVLVSLDSQLFLNVAKLRAIRHFLQKYNESTNSEIKFQITITPSTRELTVYDPWVNILRINAACFSAMLGGANSFLSVGHDVLVKETKNSKRIAQNIFDIYQQESHLPFIIDPMKGSFSVEKLTTDLIEKSWAIFQNSEEINWDAKFQETNAARKTLLMTQKTTKVGASSFANPDESLKSLYNIETIGGLKNLELRAIYDLECLREKLQGSKAALILSGDLTKLGARVNFCHNFFGNVGIKLVETEDASSFDTVILCSTDGEYNQSHVSRLKGKRVFIAGKPKNVITGAAIFNAKSNIIDVLSEIGGRS